MKYSGFVFISFAQHLTDFDAKSINIRFEQIHQIETVTPSRKISVFGFCQ